MSRVVLERELNLIRQRLEPNTSALAEEITIKDKVALEEALKEQRKGRSIPFKACRPKVPSIEDISVTKSQRGS
jgi:hypothetical protein